MATATAPAAGLSAGLKLNSGLPGMPNFSTAPAAKGNMRDFNYATSGGTPVEQYTRSLEQQDAVRNQIFRPQMKKALDFALNRNAPSTAALTAAQRAQHTGELTRAQFLRDQQRSGSTTDPLVAADIQRKQALSNAKLTTDSANMASQGTREQQTESLADVTGVGVNTARQALGLQAGAASAFQDRQNRNEQLDAQQKSLNAQAQQANMTMAMTTALTVASIAIA